MGVNVPRGNAKRKDDKENARHHGEMPTPRKPSMETRKTSRTHTRKTK